jgi:NADPH2:quinone reductase
MKAIVLRAFGSSENFYEADLPTPVAQAGEVLIRVHAASFNPVDFQVRKGQAESKNIQSMILGRDLSGVIEAVGEGVTSLRVGDEVYSNVAKLSSNGTYAEYVSIPEELVAIKPVSLSHAEAAGVPVVGTTAWLALEKARLSESKSVFIAGGAGGVGTFAIMLARSRGVRNMMTTAGSTRSRAYLTEQLGFSDSQIVQYKDPDFVAQALKRNGGGFDVVLDLVGGDMLAACCRLLAFDAELVSVTDPPSKEDFEFLFDCNASFHPIGANAYSFAADRSVWRKYREILDSLTQDFIAGALLAPKTTVLGGLSVQVVKEAHALLEAGAVQGKLVMTA